MLNYTTEHTIRCFGELHTMQEHENGVGDMLTAESPKFVWGG
jgi:hypothetical protein